MNRMFGWRIKEFVWSLDIVDEDLFRSIMDLIHSSFGVQKQQINIDN